MAKKTSKHRKMPFALLLMLVLLVGGVVVLYEMGYINIDLSSIFNKGDNKPDIVESGDFSVHNLELGNEYAGDATYIKAGDIDILIDAGSRENSADDIINYVDQFCTDGKLEYVIATHAHQDHIAAFVSTKSSTGIFDYYEVETIIDFGRTNSTSSISKKYIEARDKEVANGAVHYSANELFGDDKKHSNVFELPDGTKMTILEQKYYTEKSSDENNYSVCTLFENGGNAYLLTGDLEKEGEESLVELNPNLPQCVYFKGGHHGSPTSSNEFLLEKIKPEIVGVCCCAGTDEYTENKDNQFPSQAFIDRIARYTDKIYVTSLGLEDGFTSYNGNIMVYSTKDNLDADNRQIVSVKCSNNDIILKDSEWFKANRVWPSYGV